MSVINFTPCFQTLSFHRNVLSVIAHVNIFNAHIIECTGGDGNHIPKLESVHLCCGQRSMWCDVECPGHRPGSCTERMEKTIHPEANKVKASHCFYNGSSVHYV